VVDNTIGIPKELLSVNQDVALSIDGMTVNSLKFLTTISHDIMSRTAQYLSDGTAKEIIDKMNDVEVIYRKAELKLKEIHCDNEFRKSMDIFAAEHDPPIQMNYASADKHVPCAERNNRTIKKRVRTIYHRLPYEHLTRTMVKYLVMEATRKINFALNKNGISKYYSP